MNFLPRIYFCRGLEKNPTPVGRPRTHSSRLWYRAFKGETGTLGLHRGETLFVVNKQRKTGICNSLERMGIMLWLATCTHGEISGCQVPCWTLLLEWSEFLSSRYLIVIIICFPILQIGKLRPAYLPGVAQPVCRWVKLVQLQCQVLSIFCHEKPYPYHCVGYKDQTFSQMTPKSENKYTQSNVGQELHETGARDSGELGDANNKERKDFPGASLCSFVRSSLEIDSKYNFIIDCVPLCSMGIWSNIVF